MTTGSANLYPKVILEEVANDGSATVTPAADYRALFLGEDGLLHVKDSGGTVTSPYTTTATFTGCRVYNSAAQALSATTETTITFNTESYDAAGLFASNVFTANATGKWRLAFFLYFAGNSSDLYAYLRLDPAGSPSAIIGSEIDFSPAVSYSDQRVVTVELTSGNTVDVRAYRTNAGNVGAAGAAVRSWFEAQYLGA